MTIDEAISQVIGYIDNAAPTDAANADRKVRSLQYIQETFNDVYYHAEWWFRWAVFSVTILSGDAGTVLDSEFSDLPAESDGGTVYNTATGDQLRIVRPSQVLELQYQVGYSTPTPKICAVFGQEAASPYRPLIQVPTVSQNVSLEVNAHKKPPVLVQGGTTLNRIPSQWHQSVIIPGARMLAQKSKGDIKEWQSHYERGLQRMKAAENQVKGANFALPGFFGR